MNVSSPLIHSEAFMCATACTHSSHKVIPFYDVFDTTKINKIVLHCIKDKKKKMKE